MAKQQTTVALDVQDLYAGLLDKSWTVDKLTGFTTAAGIAWGDPVFFRNFANRQVVATGDDNTGAGRANRDDYIDGFVIHEHNVGGTISANQEVAVLRRGLIWVDKTAASIVAGDDVYWDLSGEVLATAGTKASGDITFYGLKFLTSTSSTAGELALLEVNLPNYQVTT